MKALYDFTLTTFEIPEAYAWLAAAVVMLLCGLVLVTFAAIWGGLFSYFERRIAGRIMSRIGPNRVGPQGLLQFVADAVKLIFKEDLIPKHADRPLYRLAPYLAGIGVFAGFAVLPFSHRIIAVDLNIGILYVLAITSISVVGILMSGWASNSKWALFGGMRSAAQIVSYELPVGLALLPGVLLAGSMSTQEIIRAQGGEPWNWYIFHSPMMFVLFCVYFISSLAEGSRVPFDLPEAESELVAGYNTEYSGFRFGVYFTAEFANTWIAAALGVIVFLGGWQIPGIDAARVEAARGWSLVGFEALSAVVFVSKMAALIFLSIQLRWTLPRVRVDQMMAICWKYLLPITFICIFLLLGWMIVWPWESTGALVWRVVMFVAALGIVVAYVRRVRFAIVNAHDRLYFKLRV